MNAALKLPIFSRVTRDFWNDEHGFVITAELVLILTLGVLALIVGLNALAKAINNELADVAGAIGSVSQTYGSSGFYNSHGNAYFAPAGFGFIDLSDECDNAQIISQQSWNGRVNSGGYGYGGGGSGAVVGGGGVVSGGGVVGGGGVVTGGTVTGETVPGSTVVPCPCGPAVGPCPCNVPPAVTPCPCPDAGPGCPCRPELNGSTGERLTPTPDSKNITDPKSAITPDETIPGDSRPAVPLGTSSREPQSRDSLHRLLVPTSHEPA